MGQARPHSHRVVSDLGRRDCWSAFFYRSCHLSALLREASPVRRGSSAARRVPHSCARTKAFSGSTRVSLDYGRFHVHAVFTAFLPRVGVQFPWVTWHWVAGAVLTASVIFHIFHASFWLDFWSIWPDRIDITDARNRILRFMWRPAPPPRKFAKYPLENKLYHAAIIAAGLSAIVTGVFMMSRVRTIFFPRNPYLFSDMAWGMLYVLHGLAGVGLIALIMVHVYFGIRPEKRPITKSMIFGWMSRDFYLKEHDPERWVVETPSSPSASASTSKTLERRGLTDAV